MRQRRRGLAAVVVVCICTLLVPPASAQVAQGVILGSVRDSSDASVPGAQVTLTHVETNRSYQAITDTRGFYRSVPLPIGTYAVTVEAAGFERTVRTGITLAIQQEATVDLTLEVGNVTDEVTVTGGAPLLQATEASRGEVIGGNRIVDLPLDGRNYLQLARLSPGTNPAASGARGGGFSSGGLRASHNTYLLDGIDNQNYQHAGTSNTLEVLRPSVDAIDEFKVQTNAYSAEFGGGLGAAVNVSLKAGSNRYQGGLFEFNRHDRFAARNFFADPDEPVPPYRRDQFGGQIGGPILQNRTFFFFNYEGGRIRTSRTVRATVPTERERNGDFSQSMLAEEPVQIFDPLTYDPATDQRQPFPNNRIPPDRLDPVGANLVSLYPLPNLPGFSNNYLWNPLAHEDADQFHVRVDHVLSPRQSLFGRFSYSNWAKRGGIDGSLPAPAYGGGTGPMGFSNRPRSGVVNYSRLFGSSLFSSTRVGFNRLPSERSAPTDEDLNPGLGLQGVTPLPGMVDAQFTGYTNLGHTGASLPTSEVFHIASDLTYTSGRHALKMGGEIRTVRVEQTHYRYAQGRLFFDGRFTRQLTPRVGGHTIADLLLGGAQRADITTLNTFDQRRRFHGLYLQHDFRATSQLTLNLGVRYDYLSPWWEAEDRWSNYDIDTDPANPTILTVQGDSLRERALVDPSYNNFAPRVGVAYKPNDRTVVRSGYGIFYGVNDHTGDRYMASGPPFHLTSSLLAGTVDPVMWLRDGYPEDALTSGLSDLQMISVQRDNPTSYAQHWNLTIQREIAKDVSVEIGYVGTKGSNLLTTLDPNAPPPGPGEVNPRRPYTEVEVPGVDHPVSLADVYRREWTARSSYHALETRLEKRFSGGLHMVAAYTWSKAMADAVGGELAGRQAPTRPQDPRNLAAEWSLADEHRPHRFVSSVNYQLPVGHGERFLSNSPGVVNAVLGGWSIGGILTLQAGRPVYISTSGNPSNTGGTDRPNRVCDGTLSGSERSLDRWFDTDCFVRNEPFTFGDSSRNPLLGPGYRNLDLAIFKTFRPTAGTSLQFRAEMFNATNTPAFGDPGGSLGTSSFGVITSAGDARIVQFGLKLDF
ncbi:MAG: TonB-dependent receptor plug domain-containing protein [Luteitalea sp.]|nr:TonB-dependent receptor plug domain-containing protein [Luteitalea sp.]